MTVLVYDEWLDFLLQCDEEIGECTQQPPKRQRKSRDGVTSNLFTADPSKAAEQGQLSWLQNNLMQVRMATCHSLTDLTRLQTLMNAVLANLDMDLA